MQRSTQEPNQDVAPCRHSVVAVVFCAAVFLLISGNFLAYAADTGGTTVIQKTTTAAENTRAACEKKNEKKTAEDKKCAGKWTWVEKVDAKAGSSASCQCGGQNQYCYTGPDGKQICCASDQKTENKCGTPPTSGGTGGSTKDQSRFDSAAESAKTPPQTTKTQDRLGDAMTEPKADSNTQQTNSSAKGNRLDSINQLAKGDNLNTRPGGFSNDVWNAEMQRLDNLSKQFNTPLFQSADSFNLVPDAGSGYTVAEKAGADGISPTYSVWTNGQGNTFFQQGGGEVQTWNGVDNPSYGTPPSAGEASQYFMPTVGGSSVGYDRGITLTSTGDPMAVRTDGSGGATTEPLNTSQKLADYVEEATKYNAERSPMTFSPAFSELSKALGLKPGTDYSVLGSDVYGNPVILPHTSNVAALEALASSDTLRPSYYSSGDLGFSNGLAQGGATGIVPDSTAQNGSNYNGFTQGSNGSVVSELSDAVASVVPPSVTKAVQSLAAGTYNTLASAVAPVITYTQQVIADTRAFLGY